MVLFYSFFVFAIIAVGGLCFMVGRDKKDMSMLEMIQILSNELEKHRKELKLHKELIELLDVKITSSNAKIDWDEYRKTLKRLGIENEPDVRDLDITNPEG